MKRKQFSLTPRKIEILRIIHEFTASRCYSPTIQEIAKKLKRGRATVFEHCAALQKNGFLSTSPNKARSLRLTPLAEKLIAESKDEHLSDICHEEQSVSGVPLLGTVAAGYPVEAFERTQTLSLSGEFGTKSVFALEVSGESMIEEDIRPKDYVICEQTATARNGDLVIACVDDTENTLKRFYKEKDCIRLEPANRNFKPILTTNCKIQAKVIGLIRKF